MSQDESAMGQHKFALSRSDFQNDRDFYRALENAFHEANGLDKREQACGLLAAIAHSAFTVSQAVAGKAQQPFVVNPVSSIAFQLECVMELFPFSQEEIDARQKDVVDVYYLASDLADQAIVHYQQEGITAEKVLAVQIEGEDRYVLRCVSVSPEVAEKIRLQPGHFLYYPKQNLKPIPESDWNPYYVEPEPAQTAANDDAVAAAVDAIEVVDDTQPGEFGGAAVVTRDELEGAGELTFEDIAQAESPQKLPEDFGDQPFVGAGSEPKIVEASFKEGDATLEDITPPQEEKPTEG